MFYKAEGMRLFKCTDLANSVSAQVTEVLQFPERYVANVDDYYQAYMLHKNAADYGLKDPAQTFYDQMIDIMKTDWIDGFDHDQFQLKSSLSKQTGVTLESIRLVEMISGLVGHQDLGEKASSKAQAAV